MNITLLKCLRKAEIRLRAAIEKNRAESNRPPFIDALINRINIWLPLAEIPHKVPGDARFYLLSAPRHNSKTSYVINEMQAAGWPKSCFFYPQKSRAWMLDYFLRFLARLPQSIMYYLALKRKIPHLDAVGQSMLMRREIYRKLLIKYPRIHPVIISDVSPELHILWSASYDSGNRAVWWQDDYHHQGPLDFPVHAAAVLNQGGYDAVKTLCPDVNIARRPSIDLKPMRPVPYSPVIGVATNVTFAGNRHQKRLIKNILEVLGGSFIRLRLHPNSKVDAKMFYEEWLKVAPPYESIEAFSESIDLAVVGNSSIQLKLLFEGLPVLHVFGLDEHQFDRYRYKERGFVYGSFSLKGVRKELISEFYESVRNDRKLCDYVRVRSASHCINLENIISRPS